jgi:hypothetical protein
MLSSSVIAQPGNRPRQYFISQNKDKTNPDAPKNNSDCGPTCLAMVARRFNKIPAGYDATPNQAERFISHVRELMTNKDNHKVGTNDQQIIRGAKQLGLNASILKPRSMQALDLQLKKGRMIIASGFPCAPGAFGPAHGYHKGNGGHFVVVCKKLSDGRYLIDDPAGSSTHMPKDKGTYTVLRKGLEGFLNSKDGSAVCISAS